MLSPPFFQLLVAWSCGGVSEVGPGSVSLAYEEISWDSDDGEWMENAILRAAGGVGGAADETTWLTTSEEQTTDDSDNEISEP